MSTSDLRARRADFPQLATEINGRPLIYLDSAATTLKPNAVIDAVSRFYRESVAGVHRAVHRPSEAATARFEGARETIARFIGADAHDVAFTRNATEALNVVAASFVERGPAAVALAEHHSNLLPWRRGALRPLPTTPEGVIELDGAARVLRAGGVKLVAFSAVSNALGVRQPAEALIDAAREAGALSLVDLSQDVGHRPLDVRDLGCDFACFSGHKMLGPGGVGVLYARREAATLLSPLLLGGSMVHEVHADGHRAQAFPWGLEAGSPNVEGVIGLAAACDYLEDVGLAGIEAHLAALSGKLRAGLAGIEALRVHGSPAVAADGIVTFWTDDMPAHGVARVLSERFGIAVRSGFHCAQPAHEALRLPETVRASLHLYNTAEEIDALLDALRRIVQFT